MPTIARTKLHELVWTRPISAIAKEFGVSDVALSKVCRIADIPVPPRGYWARAHAGHKVQRVALPTRFFGAPEELSFGSPTLWNADRSRAASLAYNEEEPRFDEGEDQVRARAGALVARVKVPKTMQRVQAAIGKVLESDEKRRQVLAQGGWKASFEPKPHFDVKRDRRAVLVLNSLLLVLEALGARLHADIHRERTTIAVSFVGTGYSIRADWVGASKSAPADRLRLTLRALHRDEALLDWRDTAEERLEAQIATIVADTLVHAELQYRIGLVEHHHRRVKERERLREEQRKADAEAERRRVVAEKNREAAAVRDLLRQARDLGYADKIRAYVEEVRGRVSRGDDLAAWSQWALAQADRIDPVVTGRYLNWSREVV